MTGGSWARLIPATKSPHVKSGLGIVNEIMVTFKEQVGAFYINGQKAFEFHGQPPKNGGTIGVFAGSEDAQQTEWRFQSLVVVENN